MNKILGFFRNSLSPCLFAIMIMGGNTQRNDNYTNTIVLKPGERLEQGESITQSNCTLRMQKDGNLVTFKGDEKLWSATGTGFGKLPDDNQYNAALQLGGNFMVKEYVNKTTIYSTRTRELIDKKTGALYFRDDCSLALALNETHDSWSNLRTSLYGGNELRKGEMFRYIPIESSTPYILHMQHDGNLVIFEGWNRADYTGKQSVLWSTDTRSDSDFFTAQFYCNGMVVLKEQNSTTNKMDKFWSARLINNRLRRWGDYSGYAVTLSPEGMGYVFGPPCQDSVYTHDVGQLIPPGAVSMYHHY